MKRDYYRSVPIADLGDIQIDYSEFGSGDPVLGIMGFSLDKRFWAAQVPAVSPTHRLITFSNRGLGRTSGPTIATIDEMAHDAVRLLDHLEIDETILFGQSMGGAIAQRVALDHPDRVKALILAVTWARPLEYQRRQHDLSRTILDHNPDILLDAALLRMFSPRFFEAGREAVDRMVAAFRTDGDLKPQTIEVFKAQLDAMGKFDVLAELPSIDKPTLVIGGKMDQMVPFIGSEEIAAAIPGAELVALETGHGCMIEEMQAFNDAVAGFLARLA